MTTYNSIVSEEIGTFLIMRRQTCSEATYVHDITHMKKLDDYLCSIECCDKNLTETQIYGWVSSLPYKRATIQKYVTCLRAFLKHLTGYGYHPFMPELIRVPDDYVAYLYSDEELEKIFHIADSCGIPTSGKKTIIKTSQTEGNLFPI